MRLFKGLMVSASLALAVTVAAAGTVLAMGGNSTPSTAKSRNYEDGERAVKAKDYAKAIPLLERAWNDNKTDADTNNLLGYSHRQMGNKEVALTYYQRALQADANHKGANEYLGELYVEMNDLPKAEVHLAKLAQVCGNTTCEEYRDLKAAIDKAKAGGPRTGS